MYVSVCLCVGLSCKLNNFLQGKPLKYDVTMNLGNVF